MKSHWAKWPCLPCALQSPCSLTTHGRGTTTLLDVTLGSEGLTWVSSARCGQGECPLLQPASMGP